MYQIGMFSKINRVTTKTLRHYDENGLLKPAFVDEETGYRYYTNDQLPRLHQILGLKQLGLSLSDIKKVMENPISTEVFLRLKEKELEQSITTEQQKLIQVRSYLRNIQGENKMEYNPVVKSLNGGTAAYARRILSSYDEYFDFMPKMSKEMLESGVKCAQPAYCFTIYHDGEYKEKDIDVEICELVEEAVVESENVKYKVIPAVPKAICILHKGPYSTLRQAYGFLYQWIRENGFEIVDNPRESYIDGIWNKNDENEWLTELQVPVG